MISWGWLRRLFRRRPKGWCDRCGCVHWYLCAEDIEEKLIQRIADQIRVDVDRDILAELQKPGMHEALQRAFSATPEEMGAAAVAAAKAEGKKD